MFQALLDKLIPRDEKFFELLEQGASQVVIGARYLQSMFQDGADPAEWDRKIKEVENRSDNCAHDVIERMHRTFVTPLDREDLHRLVWRLDDVIDYIEDVSSRVVIYGIRDFPQEARSLADIILQSTIAMQGAVAGLRNFKASQVILQHCVEINRLENQGDAILRLAIARLFREEKDVRLLLQWKEIFEILEAATDRCEDVANVIEGVVLDHA